MADRYTPPVQDIRFALEHLAGAKQLSALPGLEHADLDTMTGLLEDRPQRRVPASGEEALVVRLEVGVLETVRTEDDVQDDARDPVGRRRAPWEGGDQLGDRGQFVVRGSLDGSHEQVVERAEVVGGGGERNARGRCHRAV